MSGLIPIDTKPAVPDADDDGVIPRALSDDPHTGDGSAGTQAVHVDGWRIHTLSTDRLGSVTDPVGTDRRSQSVRRKHERSRRARSHSSRWRRKYLRALVGVVVVALVCWVCYLVVGYALENWGGRTIPNVVGISRVNAEAELAERGFESEVTYEAADEVEGHVIACDPAAGERVPEGTKIHLTISESRTIPDCVGMTREEARTALEEAGATNIRFESLVLLEEEDRVLEVRPEAGATFMSSDEITVVVGERPIVPGVRGMSEGEAREALAREGVPVRVEYEPAGIDGRFVAQRTDPGAGSKSGEDGVILYLGDPLVAVQRLADYFDTSSSRIDSFLKSVGFEQTVGHRTDDGHIVARYEDGWGGAITFCYDPWSQEPSRDKSRVTDVMQEGVRIEGVRLEVKPVDEEKQRGGDSDDSVDGGDSSEETDGSDDAGAEEEASGEGGRTETPMVSLPDPKVSEDCAREVMGICGFDNLVDSCTQQSIRVPEGKDQPGHVFYCCQGEMGTYVWTVLVRGSSDTGDDALEVVATCLPRAAYDSLDLEPFGGRICNFVAYQDEYVG